MCQALFVQDAKGVELKKDSVILKEPGDHLMFFCDRPKHEAGFLTWDALIDVVSSGENSFADNPPNAALSVIDKKGRVHEFVLFLIDKPVKCGQDYFICCRGTSAASQTSCPTRTINLY